MKAPLDELYFVWLCDQVGDSKVKNPARTYWRVLKLLYEKEFVWFVPNDDNRIEDGKDLRYEFVDQTGLKDVDPNWIQLGCSMLELMIALSRRLAFEAEGEPRDWFWELMKNIGLGGYTDDRIPTRYSEKNVDEILDRVLWRTYKRNGSGGLFPLKDPKEDQREIEIWYQLNAYLLERM